MGLHESYRPPQHACCGNCGNHTHLTPDGEDNMVCGESVEWEYSLESDPRNAPIPTYDKVYPESSCNQWKPFEEEPE